MSNDVLIKTLTYEALAEATSVVRGCRRSWSLRFIFPALSTVCTSMALRATSSSPPKCHKKETRKPIPVSYSRPLTSMTMEHAPLKLLRKPGEGKSLSSLRIGRKACTVNMGLDKQIPHIPPGGVGKGGGGLSCIAASKLPSRPPCLSWAMRDWSSFKGVLEEHIRKAITLINTPVLNNLVIG